MSSDSLAFVCMGAFAYFFVMSADYFRRVRRLEKRLDALEKRLEERKT